MSKDQQSLLGSLLPAHSDYKPILDDLRQRYNIPILDKADEEIGEFLLSDTEIPWDEIRSELKQRIQAADDLWPESILRLRKIFKDSLNTEADLEKFAEEYKPSQEEIMQQTKGLFSLVAPAIQKFEEMLDTTADLLLTFLATGETEDIPLDWIGAVQVMEIFDSPAVIAIAGPLSDPKEISKQLVAEYHRVFGKDRPKITKGLLNSADYLRMKFAGVPLKDIADIHMQRYPSEFAKDPQSSKYRTQKRRLEERLKKSLQRNERKVLKIIGDNSDP